MPRYFFDITEAGTLHRDAHGFELADDAEARDHAIVLLPDLARDALPDGDAYELVAQARNERGKVVYEARLSFGGVWWPGRR